MGKLEDLYMEIGLSFEPRVGDYLSTDGLLLLVTAAGPHSMLLAEVRCDWAYRCVNSASMLLPHLIGPVPACDRCGDPINAVWRATPSV